MRPLAFRLAGRGRIRVAERRQEIVENLHLHRSEVVAEPAAGLEAEPGGKIAA
ncbi:hypothetical protein D3C71_2146430 [compost metagenome]